jgi:hypothetical protein
MVFTDSLGVIACKCVVFNHAPVRFVSHAGGDWQFYCHDENHDFSNQEVLENDLKLVHVSQLLLNDSSLNEVADLPINMGADREFVGGLWTRFSDEDDE